MSRRGQPPPALPSGSVAWRPRAAASLVSQIAATHRCWSGRGGHERPRPDSPPGAELRRVEPAFPARKVALLRPAAESKHPQGALRETQTSLRAETRFPTRCRLPPTRLRPGKVGAPFAAAESMPLFLARREAPGPIRDAESPARSTCFSARSVSIDSGSRGN